MTVLVSVAMVLSMGTSSSVGDCGSLLTFSLPRESRSSVQHSTLELSIVVPRGVVVEIRSASGLLIGSITPFGRDGLGTYLVPLRDLLTDETNLKLEARGVEGGATAEICLQGFRVLDG